MKIKSPLKDLTLIQIINRFDTDAKARAHLEKTVWKGGIVCPKCKGSDQTKFSDIKPNPAAKTRAGLRWCSNCKDKFTVTIGTIFEDSHFPLHKWLVAYYLICSSKKGISSLPLQRILEIGSYRTALFMAHRIRHALKETGFAEKMDGTIEADECAVVSVSKGKGSFSGKIPVLVMVQRGGQVRSKVMPTVNGANLKQAIRENVKTGAQLHIDAHFGDRGLEHEYEHKFHQVKPDMPKPKPAAAPKDWKPFRLADGTTHQLPDWADKPLKFTLAPEEALRRGMTVKPPKDWRKVIKTGRKSRR